MIFSLRLVLHKKHLLNHYSQFIKQKGQYLAMAPNLAQ
jgi:hypothetical protein